jgi:hypothetical protein
MLVALLSVASLTLLTVAARAMLIRRAAHFGCSKLTNFRLGVARIIDVRGSLDQAQTRGRGGEWIFGKPSSD